MLPWVVDFDRGTDYEIEAKVKHNRRIFFWQRWSPNYKDQYEIWSQMLTPDNIHLGVHTVEIKLIDKLTKVVGGTILTKVEVLSVAEWIRQGLHVTDWTITGNPQFTGTTYYGCISSDPALDTGLDRYTDTINQEVAKFEALIAEQRTANNFDEADTQENLIAENAEKKEPIFVPKTLEELTILRLAALQTPENLQKAYGGVVVGQEANFDSSGLVEFSFSRPVVFPRELLETFEPDYEESVPELTLSES